MKIPVVSLFAAYRRTTLCLVAWVGSSSAWLSLAPPANADTYTWVGGGSDGNWSTAANWSSGVPVSSQDNSLIFAGTSNLAPQQNLSASFLLNALSFGSNAGAFTLGGPGALDFRTNTAGTLPTLTQNSASAQTINSGLSLTNNLTVGGAGTGALTLGGVITGADRLTKTSVGTLTLTATNTYTGGTTVGAGRLVASNNGNALSTGTVNVASGATLELSSTTSGNIISQAGATTFTGGGTVVKTGAGIWQFGGNGGNVNVSLAQGGLIDVQAGTLRGSSSNQGIYTNNLGSLNIAAGATFNGVEADVRVDALTGAGTLLGGYGGLGTTTVGVANGSGTFSGTIANGVGPTDVQMLIKTGAGTETLTGNNTYTGGTTFAGGILNAGSAGALGSTGSLIFQGGTLQYSTANQTDYSTRFSTADNQTFKIDTNGQNVTFATGLNVNGGGLNKLGAGTLTLTGASTFGSGVVINGGTLAVTGSGNVTGGDFYVRAGLALSGGGTVFTQSGSVYVGSDPSAAPATVTIGGTAQLTAGNNFYASNATITQSGGSVYGYDLELGHDGGTQTTYNLNAGTIESYNMVVGLDGKATLNQTGGSITASYLYVGIFTSLDSVAGVYNQSGGSLTIANGGELDIGFEGQGIYNLSGTGTITTPYARIGADFGTNSFNQTGGSFTVNGELVFGGDNATYNLDGGTLTPNVIDTEGGTSTLNLNGGTLRVGANPNPDFIQGLSRVNVRTGGAVIDTNGHSVTIAQPLLHSNIAGDNATDGGLAKLGTGTLTLAATNSCTGPTTVNAGTLAIDNNPGASTPTAGKLAATNRIIVNNGGTLLLSGSTGVNDRLNNSAALIVNSGGKFATGGLSEGSAVAGSAAGVGALTLAGGSSLDFGSGALGSTLLAASGVIGGGTISVLNWTGTARSDTGATGNDRLLFVTDPRFTAGQLAQVNFYNDGGALIGGGGAVELTYAGFTELVPVPEPATWLGGALLLVGTALRLRRRRTTWASGSLSLAVGSRDNESARAFPFIGRLVVKMPLLPGRV